MLVYRILLRPYIIWAVVLLLLKVFSGIPVLAEPTVTGVRIGEHKNKTRFVIDLTEYVDYKKIYSLSDPYRIVIDLPPKMSWQVPSKRRFRKNALIVGFRNGLFSPNTYRVVLDLKGPAKIRKPFILPPAEGKRYRLVIDLVESNRSAMLASRAWMSGESGRSKVKGSESLQVPSTGKKPGLLMEKKWIIVIDPGHGGIDPGATTSSGVFEKNIVLAAAKIIQKSLERTGRYLVYLTREKDIFVRLRKRFEIAQNRGAGVFLSLHADAIKSRKIGGMSVYTLSKKASSREAARLAKKENESELVAGLPFDRKVTDPQVKRILLEKAQDGLKMAQMDEIKESKRLAKLLDNKLRTTGKMLPNSQRSAGFAVLKSPDQPSVLIELGFLSNPQDLKNLRNNSHLNNVARAIVEALDSFCSRSTNPCTPTFPFRSN